MKLNKTVFGIMLAMGAMLSPRNVKAQTTDYTPEMTTVALTLLNLASDEGKIKDNRNLSSSSAVTQTEKQSKKNNLDEIKFLLTGLCALIFIFGARAVMEGLQDHLERVIPKKRKTEVKKNLNLSERAIELDNASREERNAREILIAKSLRAGGKRSEINVQNLRNAEGWVRGKKLAELIKSRSR